MAYLRLDLDAKIQLLTGFVRSICCLQEDILIRFYASVVALFMFSGICFAQVPKPSLVGVAPNEVSVDFLVPVKGADFAQAGYGGQVAAIHYFGEHLGVELQGDYERTNFADFRDAGARVGPIVHFAAKQAVQPYLEGLLGYARVKSSYLEPVTSFHGGVSGLMGGGLDYHISRGLYAKSGLDIEGTYTPVAHTAVVRVLLGLAYRFGAQ